jgi:hypothetical protein
MTVALGNAILVVMVATLPSAMCTPVLRCYRYPVASDRVHTLNASGAEHAGMCSKVLDDGTAA